MNYELSLVRLFVSDFEHALAFYRDTLGMAVKSADAERGWAQFRTGAVDLAIERCNPSDPESRELVGTSRGVSLRVHDIARAHDELRARGVDFSGAPETQYWGGVLAHFYDPFGNLLTLVQLPVEPS
jgi:catechol 2,3-dioxygenase-like lactoylglutathione lyase family enzyme